MHVGNQIGHQQAESGMDGEQRNPQTQNHSSRTIETRRVQMHGVKVAPSGILMILKAEVIVEEFMHVRLVNTSHASQQLIGLLDSFEWNLKDAGPDLFEVFCPVKKVSKPFIQEACLRSVQSADSTCRTFDLRNAGVDAGVARAPCSGSRSAGHLASPYDADVDVVRPSRANAAYQCESDTTWRCTVSAQTSGALAALGDTAAPSWRVCANAARTAPRCGGGPSARSQRRAATRDSTRWHDETRRRVPTCSMWDAHRVKSNRIHSSFAGCNGKGFGG
ncbi:hypothetical protein B0H14DRAFT_2584554 [Mycena olivaceomarginata]|nr:hypothetical protein B0H14DRAFT_2584554 [Mycena olivaceomarginata]